MHANGNANSALVLISVDVTPIDMSDYSKSADDPNRETAASLNEQVRRRVVAEMLDVVRVSLGSDESLREWRETTRSQADAYASARRQPLERLVEPEYLRGARGARPRWGALSHGRR